MPRRLRLQYEGAIYHVTVRGSGRRRIVRDDHDRERLFWRLSESRETYDVRLYLVCLMDRHFHLVLETPRANVSRFMQSVLTGYSVYFNLRHRTIGHVTRPIPSCETGWAARKMFHSAGKQEWSILNPPWSPIL